MKVLSILVCAAFVAPAPLEVAGKATGRILFDGPRPEPAKLDLSSPEAKKCCPNGETISDEDQSLLVATDGGLANVVLTIEVPGAKLVVPEKAIEVDQKTCTFVPHVAIVPAGAKVAFLNSDTVTHNVRAFPAKNDPFNDTVAAGGRKEYTFAKADKIQIKCDYHAWMSSWLFVTETPFHALSKRDGSFEIAGLPPGTHKVKLWHETLGRGEAEVVVKDDGTSAPIEVKMAPKKKKS